jgi:hypothetical protein
MAFVFPIHAQTVCNGNSLASSLWRDAPKAVPCIWPSNESSPFDDPAELWIQVATLAVGGDDMLSAFLSLLVYRHEVITYFWEEWDDAGCATFVVLGR